MSVSERRKALITGGARGIGRAVAKALASEGYDLYLTCHEQIGRLDSLAEELCKKYGIKCYCYAFSICDEEKVIAMYQDIPYLDILVNNAGISYIGLLTEMTYQQWREVIDTNQCMFFDLPLCSAADGEAALWKNHQYFFCVGECRRVDGGGVLRIKRRTQCIDARAGKRTGAQQYSGQRNCLRCHRYGYEQMF